MSSALPIIEADDLHALYDPDAIIAAVEDALIRHAAGLTVSAPSVQLDFPDANGDCHIKAGYFQKGNYFTVKVASGFYDNGKRGLPVNDGLVMVFNTRTGAPLALLRDAGWLTSWRTAAAGALAARVRQWAEKPILGIVGTGHQARLQAEWITRFVKLDNILVWGRDLEKAHQLATELAAKGLRTRPVSEIDALCEESRLIVTCTPATAPVLPAAAVRPGTHIVALGADSPGKQELDPLLFQRAAVVMVDDRQQCLTYGDATHARRAGLLAPDDTLLLGDVLSGDAAGRFAADDITIADLTGTAAQDVAIATLFLGKLALA